AYVEFQVLYTLPDESIASFAGSDFDILLDDQQMLIDIEQNIANIERNLATGPQGMLSSTDKGRRTMKRASTLATPDKSPNQDKRRSTFGKQRPPKDSDNDDEIASLIHESGRNSRASECDSAPVSRAGSQSSISSNGDSQMSASLVEKNRKASR
ncbi:hypothetical protein NQ314_010174, partial [Rhamnusium bicolor]